MGRPRSSSARESIFNYTKNYFAKKIIVVSLLRKYPEILELVNLLYTDGGTIRIF